MKMGYHTGTPYTVNLNTGMHCYTQSGFVLGPLMWAYIFTPLSSTEWLHGPRNDNAYRMGQNGIICFYALTLPNINRFSKLFHYENQEKNCNNTVTKDPTTPQVCRYTIPCEMSSVLKATTENKMTSVRSRGHF